MAETYMVFYDHLYLHDIEADTPAKAYAKAKSLLFMRDGEGREYDEAHDLMLRYDEENDGEEEEDTDDE